MANIIQIKVPDIGDFEGVEIIEVLVATGDSIEVEQSLITLESDKAIMEVPSTHAGTVKELRVSVGDKVSQGDVIVTLDAAGEASTAAPVGETAAVEPEPAPASAATPTAPSSGRKSDIHAECVVLGSGPGGYTAAFRAADLGKQTVLVERYEILGGVCLNVGCIPSKALLHAAKVIDEAADMAAYGVSFAKPKIDLDKLRGWKDSIVNKLTGGLAGLAKRRKITVVTGTGRFVSPNELEVDMAEGKKLISFDAAIIAAGSESLEIPGIPFDDPRVFTSTGALELPDIPERMLVIGGGIIGLELAGVYDALGTKITVVELLDQLMFGTDKDLVRPLQKRIEKRYEAILLGTKVVKVEAKKEGLVATFEGKDAPDPQTYDAVLVAVGRKPNGREIAAEAAGVNVDERGFIAVDNQQRTNVPHIFAIGDVVGQPMLAHKATHEGKVAAEVIAGEKSGFDARVIPSVAFTDPEIAWVGVTETEAKEKGIKYGKGAFPWAASGRALGLARDEGLTKLLFDEDTHRIIGAGIVGPNAGDLIAECSLAIEMNADATDIGLTIHPHPTLSETIAFAAEAYEGTITDLYIPKRK